MLCAGVCVGGGGGLLPLIRFYKATDTIGDRQRARVVLTIGATTRSFAHNESSHLQLRPSTHGRGVRRTDASARHPPTEMALQSDSALSVRFDEWGREWDLVSAGRISVVVLPCLQAWFWRTEQARLFSRVLGAAGTDELITGCLPHPLIMSWLMCFYFQVIDDGQHQA